jgi:hypothetical protein
MPRDVAPIVRYTVCEAGKVCADCIGVHQSAVMIRSRPACLAW